MKSTVKVLIFILAVCVVAACSNNANSTNSTNANTPNTTNSLATEATDSEIEVEAEAEGKSLSSEQQDIISALEEALAYIEQVDKVYFSVYENSSEYYEDGTEQYVFFNSYADIRREPALARVEVHRGNNTMKLEGEEFVTLDEYSDSYTYYLTDDSGQFYSMVAQNNEPVEEAWFNDSLPEDFKTVGHIEDLIKFFMQFPDQLSMSIEPYEGFEETNESSTMEFRRINLDFSLNQFLEHTVYLTSNFFTGNYFPDETLDSPYYNLSPDLNNYSVSILLDDQSRVNDFTVNYETQDYDKASYTHYNSKYITFFYEPDVIIGDVVLPDAITSLLEGDYIGN